MDCALDPRPSTLDPRPSTFDLRPSTFDLRPSTFDPPMSTPLLSIFHLLRNQGTYILYPCK
ncbi:MAG: hypothetical protein EBZ48_16920 [Proteobacteria bacterium]|nr:hypothetical protein [Pseudomonadota bacterium]